MASTKAYGNNGAFFVTCRAAKKPQTLLCIASDGEGWEHVSVSTPKRCPMWHEMVYVKHLFWEQEDLVIQFHPPASEYVDCHPFTLHLWRKVGTDDFCERPPSYLVGPQ